MKNSQILIIAGIIILLTAVCTLAIRSCANKSVPPSPIEQKVDTSKKWQREAQGVIDSLAHKIQVATVQKDSLESVTEKLSDKLELAQLKVKAAIKELELNKKYGDTAGRLNACDSLADCAANLSSQVEDYRHANKLLQNSVDSVADVNSLANAQREYFYDKLKEDYAALAKDAISLDKQNKKLDRKAGKRWGLGAEAGYIFDGYKAKPGVSVGIHYSIIRF